MRRRRVGIPQRRLVFLGCEGRSEVGYAALLAQLARDHPQSRAAIHPHLLQPGAGDPAELVRRALRAIADFERRRPRFAIKAVMLDLGAEAKTAEARVLARRSDLFVVWQDPDHEAMLLRHLPDCERLRPPRGASLAILQRYWADYRKGMPARRLEDRIDLAGIRRACTVEPDLCALLKAIGLL